jgi:hypothetical protein
VVLLGTLAELRGVGLELLGVVEQERLDGLEVGLGRAGLLRRRGRRFVVVSTCGHTDGATEGHEGGAEPPPRCKHGRCLLNRGCFVGSPTPGA